MRDGRDGGQRLAAEPERMQRIDILYARYLARRMLVKCHPRIQRRHTLSVIDDFDKLLAPVAITHGDGCRTGVHGVFHHLLDHRCGTVHHFSRRNLACDGIGQQSYLVWHPVNCGKLKRSTDYPHHGHDQRSEYHQQEKHASRPFPAAPAAGLRLHHALHSPPAQHIAGNILPSVAGRAPSSSSRRFSRASFSGS